MALTPQTLPDGTVYPGSVQTLLELFAQYLSAPTSPKTIYVQASAPTGVAEGTAWFDPVAKTLLIWATVPPATTPSWVAWELANGSVTTAKIADGAVTKEKLATDVQAIINALSNLDETTVIKLQEDTGGGSRRANFFVMADGTLRVTGYNNGTGKNGFGTKASGDNSALPKRCGFKPPLAGSKVAKVYCTTNSTFALTDDGRVYAAGRNGTGGQLGLGSTADHFIFEKIPSSYFGGDANPVTKLVIPAGEGSYFCAFALTSNGAVYGWGHNAQGTLGMGSSSTPNTANCPTPTLVASLQGIMKNDGTTPDKVVDLVTVGIGISTSDVKITAYALTEEGHVYSCGWNGFQQLGSGDGNTTSRSYFDKIANLNTFPGGPVVSKIVTAGGKSTVYATVAFLMSDGTVRTLGSGTLGQLGNAAIVNRGVPQTVVMAGTGTTLGESTPVVKLFGWGGIFVAVLDDATAVAWGYGGDGVLGQNSTVNQSSAVTLPVSDVKTVTLGGNYGNPSMCVTKNDGTLWSCGYNNRGQLGLGHTTTPVKVHEQVLIDTTEVSEVVFGASWEDADSGTTALLIRLSAGQVLACGWDAAGVGQLGVDASPLPISVPSFVIF